MSWDRVVTDRIADLCERTGTPKDVVRPILEVLLDLGPTPATGPLHHDVLLPRPDLAQLSVNVFAVDPSHDLRKVAADWCRDVLGVEAVAALRPLERSGVTWHPGVAWRGGQPRLKLYLTGELGTVGARLGVVRPTRVHALGVDVVSDGLVRPRSYHLLEEGRGYFEGFAADDLFDLPGPVRRLVTVLGDERRTLNLIYAGCDTLDDAEASGLSAPFGLARSLGARPSALEIDVYHSHRETDLLVTFGEEAADPPVVMGNRGLG